MMRQNSRSSSREADAKKQAQAGNRGATVLGHGLWMVQIIPRLILRAGPLDLRFFPRDPQSIEKRKTINFERIQKVLDRR